MRLIWFGLFAILMGASAHAASLTLSCLDIGRSVEACRVGAAQFAKETGNTVRVVAADAQGRSALDLYEALFSVGSPRLDVIQFPESWGPALANDLVALDPFGANDDFLKPAAEGAMVGGERIGWPQHLAITLVFVRNDIVRGSTGFWSELRESLLAAPSDGALGLSLGGADPALFPFFLDWYIGLGGDRLDDRDTLIRALQTLTDVLGRMASTGTTQTPTRAATRAFTEGTTAALVARSTQVPEVRASPFADAIMTQPRPAFRDGPAAAPVMATTWYLGVSRHSEAHAEAKALAAYLSSNAVQRANATKFGLAPTRRALYDEADVLKAGVVLADIAQVVDNLIGPPVGEFGMAYLDLADEVAGALRALLQGSVDAPGAADTIIRSVRRAQRGENT